MRSLTFVLKKIWLDHKIHRLCERTKWPKDVKLSQNKPIFEKKDMKYRGEDKQEIMAKWGWGTHKIEHKIVERRPTRVDTISGVLRLTEAELNRPLKLETNSWAVGWRGLMLDSRLHLVRVP